MKAFAGFLSFVGLVLSTIVGYQMVQTLMPSLFALWLASTILIWSGLAATIAAGLND